MNKTEAARSAHGEVDLIGQRFGKLVVKSFAGYEKGRGQWNCKCDCGNAFVANTSALRSGNTTSCRCKNDLPGQRFGELVVIKFDHRPEGKDSYWLCKCDCGVEKVVSASNLKRGNAKSCGHIKSLVGERFGRLVVMSLAYIKGATYWNCICDCGNTVIVRRNGLTTGNTQSCGCLLHEAITTHGQHSSDHYKVWSDMIRRCENSNTVCYKDYGGRGIKVCERWHDIKKFIEDMGPRPKGYEIDRIDNDGDYCKENCRWASRTEQNRNTRRNRLVTYKGKTQCLSVWEEELGMNRGTLQQRLDSGKSVEEAITTPVQVHIRKKKSIAT